jgi:hypothetical protein
VGYGRPSTYRADIADEICRRMAEGESLRSICRTEGMPPRRTVAEWVIADRDGYAERYARARELQADALADELLEIADDGRNDWMRREDPSNPGYELNSEHVQRSRLRLDARKWLASKILPKKYGEKVEAEVYGKDGTALFPVLNVTIENE